MTSWRDDSSRISITERKRWMEEGGGEGEWGGEEGEMEDICRDGKKEVKKKRTRSRRAGGD